MKLASSHLQELEALDFVETQDGRFIFYRVADNDVVVACQSQATGRTAAGQCQETLRYAHSRENMTTRQA